MMELTSYGKFRVFPCFTLKFFCLPLNRNLLLSLKHLAFKVKSFALWLLSHCLLGAAIALCWPLEVMHLHNIGSTFHTQKVHLPLIFKLCSKLNATSKNFPKEIHNNKSIYDEWRTVLPELFSFWGLAESPNLRGISKLAEAFTWDDTLPLHSDVLISVRTCVFMM